MLSVGCLSEKCFRLLFLIHFSEGCLPQFIVVPVVLSLGVHRVAHDGLILARADLVLEFFPSSMVRVTKASSCTDATTCSEDSSLPLHAKRFLWLWLELGWTKHPLMELLLLFFQDFDVSLPESFINRWISTLFNPTLCVVPWLLATFKQNKSLQISWLDRIN